MIKDNNDIMFKSFKKFEHKQISNTNILGWQLSNCGFFLENQRQFFHGTK